MLFSEVSKLALPKIIESKYYFPHKGYNQVGEEGCKHLSEAKWPLLEYIDLSNKF